MLYCASTIPSDRSNLKSLDLRLGQDEVIIHKEAGKELKFEEFEYDL